jgi:hypothetical protein
MQPTPTPTIAPTETDPSPAPTVRPQTWAMPRSLPGVLLRFEGGALLAAATVFYFSSGGHWLPFLALFHAPDLALVGYLRGPRVGGLTYNLVHTTIFPLLLLAASLLAGLTSGPLAAAIWLAHIGLDRLVGYGLKHPTSAKETRLGRV